MTGAFCAYYLNGGRACLHVFFIWKHDVIVLYLRYVHLWCTVQGLLSDDISFFRCVNQIFFFCIRVIYDRDSVHALCKLLLIIRFSQVFCYEIALSKAILKVTIPISSTTSSGRKIFQVREKEYRIDVDDLEGTVRAEPDVIRLHVTKLYRFF